MVLTIVDRLSKYAHFIALGHPYTVLTVAHDFFDHLVQLHGLPYSMVSYRDPVFTSTLWTELFTLASINLRLSFVFHPQTVRQSEVTNRVLEVYLRSLAGDHPQSLLRWLMWVKFYYNSSYQTALQSSPFHVVYGREPQTIMSY